MPSRSERLIRMTDGLRAVLTSSVCAKFNDAASQPFTTAPELKPQPSSTAPPPPPLPPPLQRAAPMPVKSPRVAVRASGEAMTKDDTCNSDHAPVWQTRPQHSIGLGRSPR
jgi:hypothetical protein